MLCLNDGCHLHVDGWRESSKQKGPGGAVLVVSYIADIQIIHLVGASNNYDMCAFLDSTFICICFFGGKT